MEQLFIKWLIEYGYIILFVWSILEGETGLVMAGVLSHTGDLDLTTSIIVAGLGGFTGDQIYFYIGRYNKKYINKTLKNHRRKFALANLLLNRYGWMIVFMQRYLYGLRTILPMAMGTTRYSGKTFAIVNLIAAMIWAFATIMLAYIFGDEILKILHLARTYWYIALPLGAIIAGSVWYYFHKVTKKTKYKGHR